MTGRTERRQQEKRLPLRQLLSVLLSLCMLLSACGGKPSESQASSGKATLPVLPTSPGPAIAQSTAAETVPASGEEQTEAVTSAPAESSAANGPDFDSVMPVPEELIRETVSALMVYDYGGYYKKETGRQTIYLTFCLATENGLTPQILEILKNKQVPAAFFINGEYFRSSNDPDGTARAILAAGQIIGSHGYKHWFSYHWNDQEMLDDFKNMEALLKEKLGADFVLKYFRPAYGSATERDLYMAQKLGYTTVMYSFNYRDWDQANMPDKASALESLKSGLSAGAIYYLHVQPCNVEALPDFIDYARAQGYTFCRIDE